MHIQKAIEQLGYTPNEAKVYLAALSLGECHVSDIAAKAKLPRTSTQVIVDKLYKDGLMNFYVQRRYKYWVAEKPERLLSGLKKREEMMQEAMPALQALQRASRSKKRDGMGDASKNMLRMLADALQQPVLIANEDAHIEYVNAAWESQFGYSLEEVRGQNPRMLQSGKTPRDVYQRMWAALTAEKMFQSDEIIDKRKDGTFFKLLTTIFPLRHGDRLFYIQVLDDISERTRATGIQKVFLDSVVRNGDEV